MYGDASIPNCERTTKRRLLGFIYRDKSPRLEYLIILASVGKTPNKTVGYDFMVNVSVEMSTITEGH